MNLSRISRGVVRFRIYMRAKLTNSLRSSQTQQKISLFARQTGFGILSISTIILPVPMSHPSPVFASEEVEPPSTIRVTSDLKGVIRFDTEKKQLITGNQNVVGILVGKSIATEENEALEAQKAAEAAQAAANAAAEAQKQKEQAEQLAAQRRLAYVQVAPVVSEDGNQVEEQLRIATINAFGEQEWQAMYNIIMHESGFNPNSYNSNSGACGLFQALPCFKMGGRDLATQINWGINYIRDRYRTPSGAWDFWLTNHWY